KAMVAIRVTDIIEVDAVHVIVPRDFHHRGDFERLVVRVRGAEPALFLAAGTGLQAAFASQFVHKLFGGRLAQVPVYLPDVNLDAMLAAGGEALRDLVAPACHWRRHRQDLAGIECGAAPEHVGQDGSEPVIRQSADSLVPTDALHPERAVAPKRPELTGQRPLRHTESVFELLAGCRCLVHGLEVLLFRRYLYLGLTMTASQGECLGDPVVVLA